MKDTIYRQDAIDAMYKIVERNLDLGVCEDVLAENPHIDVIVDELENLPSAEPEIIYCKDCVKHGKRFDEYPASEACPLTVWRVTEGHEYDYQFCVYAERRADEQAD